MSAHQAELSPQPTAIAESHILIERKDPLLASLGVYNQRSQNFYGEQLIRVMAHERAGPDQSNMVLKQSIRPSSNSALVAIALKYSMVAASAMAM